MGIDEIKSNGLNKIHQIKQEQTKETKPKDIEFQGEKGRDLLGVQGDARSVLVGRINTSSKAKNQDISEQNKPEYKPLSVAEAEAKYGERFYDYEEISKLSQEFPEVIGKLLDQKKANGKYRFNDDNFYRIKKTLKTHPELVLKFAEMKTSDTPDADYRFGVYGIMDLADNYKGNEEVLDYLLGIKTQDGEYRLGSDATELIMPMKKLPKLVQTLIEETDYPETKIQDACKNLTIDDEEYAIELAMMKTHKDSIEAPRFNYESLPRMISLTKKYPIAKELIKKVDSDGEYKYDSYSIGYISQAITKKPELEKVLEFVAPYTILELGGNDETTAKVIELIKSGNYKDVKVENLKFCIECNLEPTPENIEFVTKCSSLMCENIFYTTSKDFIPETIKEVKPEEQESFIKWLEFCNEKASKAEAPDWYNESRNDKKNVIKNMQFFVQNSEFRKAPEKYIELMEKISKHNTIQGNIDTIFQMCDIKADEIDDNLNFLKLIEGDSQLDDDLLLNLYRYKSSEKEDETIQKAITIKNAKNLYNKLSPIREKLGRLYPSDYLGMLKNTELTDDIIKTISDTIKDKNKEEIEDPLKNIIFMMLRKGNSENIEHYEKWLKIISEYFNEALGHTYYLDDALHKVTSDTDPDSCPNVKFIENLIKNKDVLEAISSGEITLKGTVLRREIMDEKLIQFEDIDDLDFEKLIQYQLQEEKQLAREMLELTPKAYIVEEILKQNTTTKEILCNNSKEEIFELMEKVENIKEKTIENLDNYINGDDLDEYESAAQASKFFHDYQIPLMRYLQFADKEAVDVLLRKRFDDAGEYLQAFGLLSSENKQLLKEMSEATNISGKPFMPTQKVEFIDLLTAYETNDMSTDKIKEMLKTGKIDIAALNTDLFKQIMKNAKLTEEEIASIPTEKLVTWDMKFAHLLAKGIKSSDEEDNETFNDIIRAATLHNFDEYIEDKSNIYGQTNAKTNSIYQEMGLDYETWKKLPKDLEVHFKAKDTNTEQLAQIAAQLTEDINTLMQTPVKGFLKKQFPKYIKGDRFVIPNEIASNKNELTKFVTILADTSDQGQMAQVWKRAQGNINNPDPNRVASAKNTLTILDHLNQRLDDLSKIKDLEQVDENGKKIKVRSQDLDLTIKMWDRIPQKDIFQGNYSTCCIGMGNGNEGAMPHYLLDTAFNMIEFVDNNTGKTMGNALCYFIKDEKGEPAFIIDNIEYKTSARPSNDVGIKLRDSITEYAANVAKVVTGKDNIPIYLGGETDYNDVPAKDLEEHVEKISFLGEIDCSQIYLDAYGNWVDKSNLESRRKLLKLR